MSELGDQVQPSSRLPISQTTIAEKPEPSRGGEAIAIDHRSREAMAIPYRLKLDTFHGTGDLPFDDYLRRFESVAVANAWTDSEKAVMLCAHLRGAAEAVQDEVDKSSYIALRELLLKRHGVKGKEAYYHTMLHSRQQRADESVQEFYSDFLDLAKKENRARDKGPLREHDTIELFLTKLEDRQLAVDVARQEPKTMQEALDVALKYLAFTERYKPETIKIPKVKAGRTRYTGLTSQEDPSSHDQLLDAIGNLSDTIASQGKQPSTDANRKTSGSYNKPAGSPNLSVPSVVHQGTWRQSATTKLEAERRVAGRESKNDSGTLRLIQVIPNRRRSQRKLLRLE